MSENLGVLVEAEDWPHGLRCAECNRCLKDGDRYSKRLDGLTDDGVPTVLIVCVGCALTEEQSPASKLEIDPFPDGDPPLTNPSPANDPLGLDQADADLAAGRARPAAKVLADLG